VNTRLVGILLIVGGLALALLAGIWLATQVGSGELQAGGAALGAGLVFIPVALLEGIGLSMVARGATQQREQSEMQKQRQLLDIVRSRGQVAIADLALEMSIPATRLQSMVHQLVGLQVFSGYVNWEKGVLYSEDAASLRDLHQCKNCGGEITLVGKGIVRCRFCGTEYYLS
jgi:hypothetical protein